MTPEIELKYRLLTKNPFYTFFKVFTGENTLLTIEIYRKQDIEIDANLNNKTDNENYNNEKQIMP